MPKSKETAEVDIGGQKVTLVRGDTPKEEWDDRLSKLVAKGTKFAGSALAGGAEQVVKNVPLVGQVVEGLSSVGKMNAATKGETPSESSIVNAAKAVGDMATTAGDVTGAATGFGKEVVGNLNENPQLVAEGKVQLQKNIADLGGREVPPPPPAYPGPEPVDTTAQPDAGQPVTGTSVVKQSQKPSAEHVAFTKTQDEITQRFKKSEESAKAADAALTADTALREKALKDEHSLALDAEALRLERAQIQSEAMTKAQEVRDSWMSRQNQLIELSRQAAADPIDPNRYWNNKDVGQKVSAVIAGALFGFTGQGMQWLQRLDSLVAQDMQAQSADRASKVAGLDKAAAQAGSIAEKAMRMGAEDAEARTLDKIAKLENIKARIEMLGKDTANSEVRVRNEMMRSQLDEKLNGEYVKLENLREARANGAAERELKRAQAAAAGARAVEEKPLNPKMLEKLNNTREMVAKLRRMKELTADKGFFNRLKRMGLEKLDPEERAKAKAFESLSYEVKTLLAKSSLQAHEAKMLEDILGSRTGIISNTEAFDEMIGTSLGSMREQLRAAQGGRAGDVQDIENFISENSPRGSNIPAGAMEEVQ